MVRAWAYKKILKIYYKSSLVYLGMRNIAIGITAIGRYGPRYLASWLDNLSSKSRGEKESRKATKRCFL